MRVTEIRFDERRKPRPRNKIVLGFEGDNMVERLEFTLPVIAEAQTAQLMMGGKYANAVMLTDDGVLTDDDARYHTDLTAEIVGTDGDVEAYVQINGSGGEAWHSDVMMLITGELPDVETEIETRFPTAVEQMLTEMVEHKADMEAQTQRVGEIAQRAETQAGAAESASVAAQQAVIVAQGAANKAQKASDAAERAADKAQAANAAAEAAAREAQNLADVASNSAERAEMAASRAEDALLIGEQYAGQLLYVGADGRAAPLKVGYGLAIKGGALVVTGGAPSGEEVRFDVDSDGNVVLMGVEFIDQGNATVLFDNAEFVDQDDCVLIR